MYALTFLYEMYDAVCIADGLFLFLVCVVPLTDMFMTSEPKFRVLNDHGTFKKFGHGFFIAVATTVAIVYMVACMCNYVVFVCVETMYLLVVVV